MGAVEEMMCVVCVYVTEEGRFVCSELGKGATSEAGKSLIRAASVVVEVCAVFGYCLLWLDV